MVHSMLSWSPGERPEAAEIIGTPLFQELELELTCRLAVRQRSRTYSASSMGRPSRQSSSTWKSHDAIYRPPPHIVSLHPPAGLATQEKHLSPPCHHTLPQTASLLWPRMTNVQKSISVALEQRDGGPHTSSSWQTQHAVTYLHTIMLPTSPILITLTSERVF